MLKLTRREDESIVIGDNITVSVIKIQYGKVLLGIEAPSQISILRDDARKRKKHGSSEKIGNKKRPAM